VRRLAPGLSSLLRRYCDETSFDPQIILYILGYFSLFFHNSFDTFAP
jgi:hypothetical protein